MLAAVSRSPGNAVIGDIPEPGPPLAGWAVVRPEAAGIRGSGFNIIPAIPPYCRVPGIIAREFQAMSSAPSPPQEARPRHRRSRPECPAAGCENAPTSPRAHGADGPGTGCAAAARAGADRGARRRAAPRAGEQACDQ